MDKYKEKRAIKKAQKAEKKAAKKRDRILRKRRELKNDIMDGINLLRNGKEAIEETIFQVIRNGGQSYGIENSIVEITDAVIRAHAVCRLESIMDPEEVQKAKATLTLYNQVHSSMHKLAVSGLKRARTREELSGIGSLIRDLEDYSPNEVARMKEDILEEMDNIKEIVNDYNNIMQENQNPDA